jgi:hypothetical protein
VDVYAGLVTPAGGDLESTADHRYGGDHEAGGACQLALVNCSTVEEFEERSGTVIVLLDRKDLVWLDLVTKVVTRLNNPGNLSVRDLFLHETNLVSLMTKTF